MGGTGDAGKVSVNGKIYEDAVAYALVKNETGKVKVYKENMYRPLAGYRLIASKTDRSKYYIGELNGRSAKQVYQEIYISTKEILQRRRLKILSGKSVGKMYALFPSKKYLGADCAALGK